MKRVNIDDKVTYYKYSDDSDPLPLMKYQVVTVKDAPYYGCVEYGRRIILNINKAIPISRRIVTLIHEGLHVLNQGWSHGKLHSMAVHIFSMPLATATELALMSKSHIDEATLALVKEFSKKHIHKILRNREMFYHSSDDYDDYSRKIGHQSGSEHTKGDNVKEKEKENEKELSPIMSTWTPDSIWMLIDKILGKLELHRGDKAALTSSIKRAYDLEPSLRQFMKSIGL